MPADEISPCSENFADRYYQLVNTAELADSVPVRGNGDIFFYGEPAVNKVYFAKVN